MLYKPRDVHHAFWAQASPTPLNPPAQLLGYSKAAAELLEMKPGVETSELFRQFVSGEVRVLALSIALRGGLEV